MEKRVTQKDKLKGLFLRNPDEWIPLTRILSLYISQFGARLLELRADGMSIDNKLEMVEGAKHSFYRYNKPNESPPYQIKLGSQFWNSGLKSKAGR